MKKLLLPFLTLLFFTACDNKKKEQPTPEPTTWDLLIGTWSITHTGDDENKNNNIEESEKEPLDNTETIEFTFRKDGTMINKYEDKDFPEYNSIDTLKWKLTNNNSEMLLIDDSDPNMMDSSYIIIHSFNATNMILRDKEYADADWAFFVKK